jgi:hypothetical protein
MFSLFLLGDGRNQTTIRVFLANPLPPTFNTDNWWLGLKKPKLEFRLILIFFHLWSQIFHEENGQALVRSHKIMWPSSSLAFIFCFVE